MIHTVVKQFSPSETNSSRKNRGQSPAQQSAMLEQRTFISSAFLKKKIFMGTHSLTQEFKYN
jgi:hypothetical protein